MRGRGSHSLSKRPIWMAEERETDLYRSLRFLSPGTDASNPVPSGGESGANLIFGAEFHR